MTTPSNQLLEPIVDRNPITLQILGICSALAVTTTLSTALTMSVSLTVVLILSSVAISLIRNHMPSSIRLIVQITIIASIVIVIDQVLRAYAFDLSRQLSIFVGLIVTNCLVLGRAEGFAMRHPPAASAIDALGNGLGYSLVLIVIGAIRELLGAGTLLGAVVLPTVETGGWFQPLAFMLKAPAAFFLLGFLVWVSRSWRPGQVEEDEFTPAAAEGQIR
jgi:Na+-transporting NADH:ubiquinone oxidoreductase subunit D